MLRANIPVILLGHVIRYIEVDLEAPPKTLKLYEPGSVTRTGPDYSVDTHVAVVSIPSAVGGEPTKMEIVYAGDKGKESLARAQQVAPTRPIPEKE